MEVWEERTPRVGVMELWQPEYVDEFAGDIPGFLTWVQMEDPMFHGADARRRSRADEQVTRRPVGGGQLHDDARSLNDLREEFAPGCAATHKPTCKSKPRCT
jgi:hypothetical protein